MPITFTVTDLGTGLGGTATITGSSGTNTLYRSASFDGTMQQQSWTLVGSRSGDGTISIVSPSPVPLGYYLWKLVNSVAADAEIFYANLTDISTKSVMDRILEAVGIGVVSLSLSGMSSTRVLERWRPKYMKEVDTTPMTAIAPMGAEDFPGILTGRDDVGYPVAVVLLDKNNQDFTLNRTRNLLWREKVLRKFRWQRLSGVQPEVYNCRPMPGPVVDADAWEENIWMSVLGFRFISREPRGV